MDDRTRRITPIFLFSLPRSGSTLTQRILATHAEIETVSEPWILLPFLYTRRRDGVYTEYGHRVAYEAIEDFCEGLPGGDEQYLAEIKEFTLRLYERRSHENARYFLDKTPRYHLVSAEIMRLFSDARFIFLWRNPLAIVASIIETWGKGRWNLFEFEIDMFEGLDRLVATYRESPDRAYSIRYEDLTAGGAAAWEKLFGQLGLRFDEAQMARFDEVSLPGRMGDQTGRKAYDALSQEPLDKWKKVLASPLRKWWCRRYLRWIGEDRLRVMGYESAALLRELDSIPARPGTVISDVVWMLLGRGGRLLEPWIIRDKLARLRRRKRLHTHS